MNSKIIKKENIDDNVSLESRLDMNQSPMDVVPSDKKVISKKDAGLVKKASQIIEKAMHEAKQIKQQAKDLYLQVETKMKEAEKKGFEEGHQEGLASVTELLTQIQKQNQEMVDRIEKEALSLVYEISQKLIGETLQASETAIIGMIRQALQSSMGNELILLVNPEDFERVKAHEAALLATIQNMQTMQIKPSEHVKQGGCVVESELGSIDAQLDIQLEAIKKALGI